MHPTKKSHFALRIWRLGALFLLAWCLGKKVASTAPAPIQLPDVQKMLPTAVGIVQKDGTNLAVDATGQKLAQLHLSLPVKGYRGPAEVLLVTDGQKKLLDWQLLHSPDTPEHVHAVLQNADFRKAILKGDFANRIDGVSGATLTSLAISEGIRQKLGDKSAPTADSVKFPEPISLLEAKRLFPQAATLRKVGEKFLVADAIGAQLGWLTQTAPAAEEIHGYQGPTNLLIALSADETTVLGVRIRRSFDNAEYVNRITSDEQFLASFARKTVKDLSQIDLKTAEIQGVSGATLTSFAIAESLKTKLKPPPPASSSGGLQSHWSWQSLVIAAISLVGLGFGYSAWRGIAWVRWVWQALLVALLGFGLGAPLSLHYLTGWLENGWNFAAPGLIVLGCIAILGPWAGGKQVYCHQLCPHGHAQLWLAKWSPWKLRVTPKWDKILKKAPSILLMAALTSLTFGWGWNLMLLEPFDAWLPRIASKFSIAFAILSLAASLAVPQAYCKYGCPTGALLKWLRYKGTDDRWGTTDSLMGLVVLVNLLRQLLPTG